jgi:hypothetical protein
VTPETLLRQVVRGERPIADLQQLDVRITHNGNVTTIENPRGLVLLATADDVASGVLRYENHPKELREWAWLLLAADTIYDLDLEGDQEGETLLNAVWDLSFGKELSSMAAAAARRIGSRAPADSN